MPTQQSGNVQSEYLHIMKIYVAILNILEGYLMIKKRIHSVVKCEKNMSHNFKL